MNLRQSGIQWVSQFGTAKAVHSPGTGNFPQKVTLTSEKLHSQKVWDHGRR